MSTQTSRKVVRSIYGGGRPVYHVLAVQFESTDPHGTEWDIHDFVVVCGRSITGSASGDTYSDGTPLRICKHCERATS